MGVCFHNEFSWHLQAFGAVEAMTDRYCIHFKQQAHISAEELATCCETCGMG